MDANTEKMCLEEIDHLVLDAGKKVRRNVDFVGVHTHTRLFFDDCLKPDAKKNSMLNCSTFNRPNINSIMLILMAKFR